jgi:hypothetical protein
MESTIIKPCRPLFLHELKLLGPEDQVAAKPNQYDQEVKRGFRWDKVK